MRDPWWLLLACGVVTYVWRGLGVALSGRIKLDSPVFMWITCVAYSTIAGLIMRIMVMPSGALASSMAAHRAIACAVALAAYYLSRRNLFAGVATGTAILTALEYWLH